MLSQIIKH